MQPKLETVEGGLHLRYHVPHHVHTSKAYPLFSPNGSTVIVSGHEQGLLVIWRGGRSLKNPPPAEKKTVQTNGTSKDTVISIDSSDDESSKPAQPYVDQPQFEDEEEEFDPARPYSPIIQQLNLPLGTAVLHISFPPIPQSAQRSGVQLFPAMLQDSIVVAAACADGTIKLLTIPLIPPSPQSKARKELRDNTSLVNVGHGSWGEELFTIPSASGQQSLVRGISIAFASRPSLASKGDDDHNTGHEDEAQDDAMETGLENQKWDLLVASHTADLSGTLSIHRIPVSDDGWSFDKSPEFLWQSQLLPSPAVAAQLYVSTNSTRQQPPRVLVALANGAVKIFECYKASNLEQGFWSLSLYPGLTNPATGTSQHRAGLDAQWVLGGEGIVVLMADGEWGIWDLSSKKSSMAILGSVPSKFSLNGWIVESTGIAATSKSSSSKTELGSRFVPMTPATRKVRSAALFSGSSQRSSYSTSGGICVNLFSGSVTGKGDDETVLIWHGENIITIPNLRAHMQSKSKASSNVFGGAGSGQIREINHVNLGSEMRTNVSIFPPHDVSSHSLGPPQSDILVSGERGFVILTTPLSEPRRSVIQRPQPPLVMVDQQLLARRELDVDGMDRILDGMANGVKSGETTKRKFGFAV